MKNEVKKRGKSEYMNKLKRIGLLSFTINGCKFYIHEFKLCQDHLNTKQQQLTSY